MYAFLQAVVVKQLFRFVDFYSWSLIDAVSIKKLSVNVRREPPRENGCVYSFIWQCVWVRFGETSAHHTSRSEYHPSSFTNHVEAVFGLSKSNEPRRAKTGFLHMRKQRRRSALR